MVQSREKKNQNPLDLLSSKSVLATRALEYQIGRPPERPKQLVLYVTSLLKRHQILLNITCPSALGSILVDRDR